jgi:hypothetical protein
MNTDQIANAIMDDPETRAVIANGIVRAIREEAARVNYMRISGPLRDAIDKMIEQEIKVQLAPGSGLYNLVKKIAAEEAKATLRRRFQKRGITIPPELFADKDATL